MWKQAYNVAYFSSIDPLSLAAFSRSDGVPRVSVFSHRSFPATFSAAFWHRLNDDDDDDDGHLWSEDEGRRRRRYSTASPSFLILSFL